MKLGATLTTGKELDQYLKPKKRRRRKPRPTPSQRKQNKIQTKMVAAATVQPLSGQVEEVTERCAAMVI